MATDPSVTSLDLEYFCAEGDTLWNMTDQDLIALASRGLRRIGLVHTESTTGWAKWPTSLQQSGSLDAGRIAGGAKRRGARFNLWDLNTDQDFLEEGVSITDEELNRMEAAQPTAPEMVLLVLMSPRDANAVRAKAKHRML